MSGLHAYFRSSRPPKPRGLHASFRQARSGDCQSTVSSCTLPEVVTESSDAEMTDQVQFVNSDSDNELMQPHKLSQVHAYCGVPEVFAQYVCS